MVTVEVEVGQHRPNSVKGRPYRVVVEDAQASFQLVFFHPRADWIRKSLPSGQRRIVSGKLEIFDGLAQMVHPDFIALPAQVDSIPKHEPVYPLSAGLTQKLLFRASRSALDRVTDLPEWIDPSLIKKQEWAAFRQSLRQAHNPTSLADVSHLSKARSRLAYDEFFAHQVTLALARQRTRKAKGHKNIATGALTQPVLKALPFELTGAQTRAVGEIRNDLANPLRMNRLLQGDVGSGKTLVALMGLLAVVEAGGQGVLMAPTEILARQHYDELLPLAEAAGVRLAVLTGRDRGADRAAKLKDVADGNIQILVGTHAVFQKDVAFGDLRLAVIDEQHRFGVRQRMELGAKGSAVDILVMTATPIPRSLALAQYGDMDVSILDEKTAGAKTD